MKKKTVFILVSDSESHDLFYQFCNRLNSEDETHEYVLINGHGQEKPTGISLYKDFGSSEIEKENLSQKIREEYNIEPSFVINSDQELMYHDFSREYFIRKAFFTLKKLDELCEEYEAMHVFSPGGGTLFTNCCVEYFQNINVKVHRIYPIHYFNPDQKEITYHFCPNNYFRLREKGVIATDSERFLRSREKAKRYIDYVKNGKLQPDRDARSSSKRGAFSPNGLGQFFKVVFRFSVKSILKVFGSKRRNGRERVAILAYFSRVRLDLRRWLGKKVEWKNKNYFLCVLHHPIDSQLTFRGRHFRDQIAMVRLIASNLPEDMELIVKEHPVFPGMMPYSDIRQLEKMYPHCHYMDYSYNDPNILRNAKGLITINSTAGIEAMIFGVPVLVLGECFYRGAPGTYQLDYFWDLTQTLTEMLLKKEKDEKKEHVIDILSRLFYDSEPVKHHHDKTAIDYIAEGIKLRVHQEL